MDTLLRRKLDSTTPSGIEMAAAAAAAVAARGRGIG